MTSKLLWALPVSIALFAPSVAWATPTFPDAVKTDLSLSYTPPCTICHTTPGGGAGTASQKFAESMKDRGLMSNNTDTVAAALAALDGEHTDSDCDGIGDVAQLKEGRDPNTGEYIDGSGKPTPEVDGGCVGEGGGGTGDGPRFGCGAQLAADPLPDTTLPIAATLATMIGLALTRRRRRA
ncbi:Hypothetical protein A7982_09793 [Minicystis rosea]|nr:Hypothetical protein A7982_09793 [Minicystis rosea]